MYEYCAHSQSIRRKSAGLDIKRKRGKVDFLSPLFNISLEAIFELTEANGECPR